MLVWGYRGVTKGTPRSPLWNVWERQTSVWHVFGFIRMNLLLRALRALCVLCANPSFFFLRALRVLCANPSFFFLRALCVLCVNPIFVVPRVRFDTSTILCYTIHIRRPTNTNARANEKATDRNPRL